MSQVLEAQIGREKGSRSSGRLRRDGVIPCVLYGLGMEPVALSVEWPALRRVLTAEGGTSAPIRLRVAGKEHLTLVKDLQRHPVRRDVMHIDFLAVNPMEIVSVDVQIVLSGAEHLATSLVDKVVLVTHALTVNARPGDIPTEIAVDVSSIEEGNQLRIGDLVLPAGVSTDSDPMLVVVVCGTPTTGAAAETVEEGAGEEGAEAGEAADAGEGEAEG